MMPSPMELIIILAIVLLIFGGKRLKNIGSDLGGAIKGFKSTMKETCLLYTSPSPRDKRQSRMPSSA